MYPLKFKRHLVKKIWGGREFQESLNIELPDNDLYGESWEVSSHQNGMSFIENGIFQDESLENLLKKYKDELVGEDVYKKYGENFPILIKYLDINDKLSVQVHPDDKYALRVEGTFGKAETWYVLDATFDATFILGIKAGITKENFIKKFQKRDFENLFNIVSVKKGDFINISHGIVHGTLTGSALICEIQQSSDITYRIYDYDRDVDGKKRELHLDKAIDIIEFSAKPEISEEKSREKKKIIGACISTLIKGEYFSVEKLDINGYFKDETNQNFKVYSILEGSGKIIYNKKKYLIKKGNTYFIPCKLEIEIKGKVEILKTYL